MQVTLYWYEGMGVGLAYGGAMNFNSDCSHWNIKMKVRDADYLMQYQSHNGT